MASPASAVPGGFFATQSLTNFIRQGTPVDVQTAEALESICNSGNSLLKRVAAVEQTLSGGGSGPAIADLIALGFRRTFTNVVTVSATTTMMTYADPVYEGDALIFGIVQDATGGRQITWDANLIGAPTGIDQTAGIFNVFRFSAISNPNGGLLAWFLDGNPNLGIVI